jgi:hypothetical protein
MFVLSLITLTIAAASALLSVNIKEEVVRAAMGCIALISVFLTLVFAPWGVKLLIVAILLIIDKLGKWTAEKSTN